MPPDQPNSLLGPSDSRPTRTAHVLWARSERYKTPFVVAAWSDGYRDAWSDAFWTEVEERKSYVECLGEPSDGPWVFCLTAEQVPEPSEDVWTSEPLDPDVMLVPMKDMIESVKDGFRHA